MSDRRCPTCLRPVPAPVDFDPTKHCPRLMGWPLGPAAQHTIACLALGITARDAEIGKLKADLARELGNVSELEQERDELKRDRGGCRG